MILDAKWYNTKITALKAAIKRKHVLKVKSSGAACCSYAIALVYITDKENKAETLKIHKIKKKLQKLLWCAILMKTKMFPHK